MDNSDIGKILMTGIVKEVIDNMLYEIIIDIPGVIEGAKAYPVRGEIDEPRPGDLVSLICLDPVFYSYFLYQKLKEDDFIGFRSNGKMIDITKDSITVGIFDENESFNSENPRPTLKSWIKLKNDGGIEINSKSDSDILINGDVNIKVNGSTTIQSSKIDIKGPGTLTCKGVVTPSQQGGPFIAVPVAPPPGTPMISGDTIILS